MKFNSDKIKKIVILILILWILTEIFLISPIAVSVGENAVKSVGDSTTVLERLFVNISSLGTITKLGKYFISGKFMFFSAINIAFWLIILIIAVLKAKDNEYQDIEHGSADWAKNGEQYKILSKKDGIILAKENCLPLDKRGNINVLVVGGSGSGKSASYVKPNVKNCLGSYIFTDPKGELYDDTAGYLKERGYEIKLLNLVNPESSDCYNPLSHVRSEIDVDIIANTIIKGQKDGAGSSSSDPYWDNTAESLLKALIFYLLSCRPPEEQNLASCAEMVRAASSDGNSSTLHEIMNKLPENSPARRNFNNVAMASDKTFSTILSSLQSKLGKFDSKVIADVTSSDTIDFDEIATKKIALYVVASDTHSAYDFLLTIFFSQLIQQLYDYADKHGGRLTVPAFFMLDEFVNIGQIPDFDKKISTSRSRAISFSVVVQNLEQLKAVYEKTNETIIGNCDTLLFLGSPSYSTLEYFSKQLGEKTITHYNVTHNRKAYTGQTTGYSDSDQIMGRALMTPDELRRMEGDKCIILERGVKPIKADKYYYYEDKTYLQQLKSAAIDHNAYECTERGNYRIFNPNNPYVDKQTEMNNTKIEELMNDLFVDASKTTDNSNDRLESNVNTGNENEINKFITESSSNNDKFIIDSDDDTNVDFEDVDIDIGEELRKKYAELFADDDNAEF